MRLLITLPTLIFLETEAFKIKAEGPQGGFCLLPRHIDYVSSLVPGLFSYVGPDTGDKEQFFAMDAGLLVKLGAEVLVACTNIVSGKLGELEEAVMRMIDAHTEQERKSRTSLARLEADFVRRFVGFEHGR